MACATNVRHVLPTIRVPTLVIHRTGDQLIPVGAGRYLAEHIPGARMAELPGDEAWIGDADDVADEVEEFLTGFRRGREVERVLATVLFTDIVGSTERAAAVDDRAWRDSLDRHDAVVREQLQSHRGREVKTTGDGVLAAFDGPARTIRRSTRMYCPDDPSVFPQVTIAAIATWAADPLSLHACWYLG